MRARRAAHHPSDPKKIMDIYYLLGIAVFFALISALALGCARLQKRQ